MKAPGRVFGKSAHTAVLLAGVAAILATWALIFNGNVEGMWDPGRLAVAVLSVAALVTARRPR
jgi:hypothetical protein